MKTVNSITSACRYCRYYMPEGRRGGVCQQLGVDVRGSWKACALALPAFAPSWENIEGIAIVPNEAVMLKQECSSSCSLDSVPVEPIEEKIASTSKNKTNSSFVM